MRRTFTGLALAWFALAWFVAGSSAAKAQAARPSIPTLPGGDGVVAGQLEHPEGSRAAAGANVVLYGLASDGAPGVRDTLADAEGRFRFEAVSTAEGAVYLIGARHKGVPFFGPRVSFAAGQKRLDVRVAVSDPVEDASRITPSDPKVVIEWGGTALEVLETHRVGAAGGQVVFVEPERRASAAPLLELRLPEAATGFAAVAPSIDDAFTRDGARLRYWGPVYPGEPTDAGSELAAGGGAQDVRFTYRLPIAPSASPLGAGNEEPRGSEPLELVLPPPPGSGAAARTVLVPEAGGLTLAGEGLTPSGAETLGDRRYRRFTYRPPGPGARLRIGLPRASFDSSAIGLARADYWLEMDDIAVNVNVALRLDTRSPSHVVGSAAAPALQVPLPEGAELLGLSAEARELGARPVEGGIAFAGPIPPGESALALRFRLPTNAGGAQVPLRVPIEAPVVNVLVADTGVAIESDRLHRRRPFASGTRTYLHREAYRVMPDETLTIALRPVERGALPQPVLAGAGVLAMAGATLFLVAPLRRQRRQRSRDEHESPWALRRAGVVQDIRDLDHDFETGKIGRDDYDDLRSRMRAEAIELLRREEREREAAPTAAGPSDATHPPCESCGARIEAKWKYCPECGAERAVAPPA